MTDAVKKLFELLVKKEKSGSDYTGKVTRVDDKRAYVQFDGSEIVDTPVTMSINAEPGDVVRVRVANGKAWLTGNDSNPPNDSSGVRRELAATNARINNIETQKITGKNGWISLGDGTFAYGGDALSWNGKLLKVKGTIQASSGEIAGWEIAPSGLSKEIKSGGNRMFSKVEPQNIMTCNVSSSTGDAAGINPTGIAVSHGTVSGSTYTVTDNTALTKDGVYTTGHVVASASNGNNSTMDSTGLTTTGTVKAVGAGEHYVEAQNVTTNVRLLLTSSDVLSGIWTNGYYTGSSFAQWPQTTAAAAKYLIHQQAGGFTRLRAPFTFGDDFTYSAPVLSMDAEYSSGYMIGSLGGDGNALYVMGQFGNTTSNASNWTTKVASLSTSDPRLKENIDDCDADALSIINQIQLHSFDWKESKKHWDVGFIAPELYEIDQRLAIEPLNENGCWAVDDFYLTGIQTKAIQELSTKVAKLEAEVEELKKLLLQKEVTHE